MAASSPRMPVYFLGIGGPNFIENPTHPAYSKLAQVGREVTALKPKAVVVFSAHWQESSDHIAVNVAEETDIIYDFYNFPPHYYEYQYPNRGSPEIAEQVMELLGDAGIKTKKVRRGLDHGVWTGFLVAFDPKNNPLNVPIVQVSLYDNEDVNMHYRLGQALKSLRDEGVLIVGAGMAVHNLMDFRASRDSNKTMPYATEFDEALHTAVTTDPTQRQQNLQALSRTELFRKAHPTLDHILPLYIAAGAGGDDEGVRVWSLAEKSLSWAQFRFGALSSTKGRRTEL